MVTREITIALPDDIAQAAEARGLLTPAALELLIRAEVGRREYQRLRAMMDDLASLDEPPLTNEELNAEIHAARVERRAKRAPGS
jgi:DNA-binding GntR family transcriptional regulator